MGYVQKLGNFELGTGACADSGVCGGPGTDPPTDTEGRLYLLLWCKQWSLSLKCQKQIRGDLARKLQFKGELKELPFYLKPSP